MPNTKLQNTESSTTSSTHFINAITLINGLPYELQVNIINRLGKKNNIKLISELYPVIIESIFSDPNKIHLQDQEDLMECWLSEPNDALIDRKDSILEKVKLKTKEQHTPFLKRTQWLCLYNHLRGKKTSVPNTLVTALQEALTLILEDIPYLLDCQQIFAHLAPLLSQTQVNSFFDHLTGEKPSAYSSSIRRNASKALVLLSKRLSPAQLIKFANLLETSFVPFINDQKTRATLYHKDTNFLINLLNDLAKHLPREKFTYFQALTLKLFKERPWHLLPSLKNLLPGLDKASLDGHAMPIVRGFCTLQASHHDLRAVAEAALKNPAFTATESESSTNRPKLLELIIEALKNPQIVSDYHDEQFDEQKVSLFIGIEVFLPFLPADALTEVFTAAYQLSKSIDSIQSLILSRIIGKIAIISQEQEEKITQCLSSESPSLASVLIYSSMCQVKLITNNSFENHLKIYLSNLIKDSNQTAANELMHCALFDPCLAGCLKSHIKDFFNFDSLHLLFQTKSLPLPIDKVRESIVVLFSQEDLLSCFSKATSSTLDIPALKNIIEFIDGKNLKDLTEKWVEQIKKFNGENPNEFINLLNVFPILKPIHCLSQQTFIDSLYDSLSTKNDELKISVLKTLSICFPNVNLANKTKILNLFLTNLSFESSICYIKTIGHLLSIYNPAEKNDMLNFLQKKLSEIRVKYDCLPEITSKESKQERFIVNTKIFYLQKTLAEHDILDTQINLDFIKEVLNSKNIHNIEEMYQYIYKIITLTPKTDCLPYLKLFFPKPSFQSLEQLRTLCQLTEQDKIELEDFIQPGYFYHEFLAFYATQYELSIGQEEILTRLAHRKKLQPSEKQALLFAHFDRLWDKSNDLLDNMALLLSEYGFHQSRLTQFFSNRHHISTAEKLATQIHKKQITSLEDLYHQLITIECQNQEGHFFTLREYLYQKMLESSKQPKTSTQPAVFS